MMEQAFVALNYVALGLVLTYCNLVSLRDVYAPKRSFAIGMSFYAVKFFIDGSIYPMIATMSDIQRLAGFSWGMFTICVSFPLLALMLWGSIAELYVNFVAVNTTLSIIQLTSFYLANLILGRPLGTPFQESYGLGTVLALAFFTVEYLCLRKPLAWMESGIQRFPHRFQVLLAELAFLASTGFVISIYRPDPSASSTGITMAYWKVFAFSVVPFLVIAALQIELSRRGRARTLYMTRVEELMATYREKVVAQLAIAERDRKLFDGLDTELERLGEQSGSAELLERIRQLEAEYERIKEGTYSDNPVYDAFLCALAARLKQLGVRPCFSVAMVTSQVEVRPQIVLILLAEVDRLAMRAKVTEGSEVNFRIRSLNGMVHMSLDIPSSWGRLRARQFVKDAGFGDDVLVSEKVEHGRTEVLVMNQKEGS